MTTDAQGDVDLDLYADVEGGEFSHEGGYEENHIENGNDLFDDVTVPSANNDFPDLNGHSSGASTKTSEQPSSHTQNYSGKRVSCYVGNLTWWTTDQDLTDAITSLGITDLIEIKFYENKVNGQSKGFAVVAVGSDASFQLLMDKLNKKELHGQPPLVTYFSKHNLNQFEAQARKDLPNDQGNRARNVPNVPGLPLARPGGILPRPGMPPGLGQPQMPLQRPGMQIQARPGMPMQNIRLGSAGMQINQMMNRPQQSLMPNPMGQGILRGPPGPGAHRMPGPGDLRGPQPRPEWDRPTHSSGFQPGQMNQRVPPGASGVPPNVPHGPPGQQHMNPAFFQMGQSGPQNGMPHQLHHPSHPQNTGPHGQLPPNHVSQLPPGQHHESPYYRPNERQDMFVGQVSEEEFQEIMEKNKSVSSSAISRAVTDASTGDYVSAIETLVMAMSLIKQSKIANDDRCKFLITSLQNTLKGIEDKYYGSGNSRVRSDSRDSRERTRRSRSRDSRERDSRRRDKHRHRSRSRERRDYYEESRYHRSRH